MREAARRRIRRPIPRRANGNFEKTESPANAGRSDGSVRATSTDMVSGILPHYDQCRSGAKSPARRSFRLLRFSIALGLLAAGAATARAETRVALVVGNSAYRAVPTLANPQNDAKDVAAKLRDLGFKVTALVNLDQPHMQRAIDDFARDAEDSDAAVFYYGGHGVQVDGRNFLLPVDFQFHSDDDVYQHAVPLDGVLKELEQGDGVHLVFLDACRTNPLRGSRTSAHAEGLAEVGNAAGFLIAFATQPDNVTFDGAGRNSPFAKSLLAHIATVGQSVSSMMIDVRKDVINMTAGAQVPWENSSLTRQFYFVPGEKENQSLGIWSWQILPVDFDTGGSNSPAAPAAAPGKGHKGAPGHGHGGQGKG
jgi:hypothetical protein